MFNKRVFGGSLSDNNGVETVVWEKPGTATNQVRMFVPEPVSGRALGRELRSLKRALIKRLNTSGPPTENISVTALVDYERSFELIRNAYRDKDIDALRSCDKFMGSYDTQHIIRSVEVLHDLGYDAAADLLDEEYLDCAQRVREAILNDMLNTGSKTRHLTVDEIAELNKTALTLAFGDMTTTEAIILLITEQGVVEAAELRHHADSLDSTLIDDAF